jgi:hypothetical protein
MVTSHNGYLAQLWLPNGALAYGDTDPAPGAHERRAFSGNRESLRMALFSRDSILWWVFTTFYWRRTQYRVLFDTAPFPQLVYVELRNSTEAENFLTRLETSVLNELRVNQTENDVERNYQTD